MALLGSPICLLILDMSWGKGAPTWRISRAKCSNDTPEHRGSGRGWGLVSSGKGRQRSTHPSAISNSTNGDTTTGELEPMYGVREIDRTIGHRKWREKRGLTATEISYFPEGHPKNPRQQEQRQRPSSRQPSSWLLEERLGVLWRPRAPVPSSEEG
ncbi:uncharacterized protein B0H64DRAFT_83474 [Chaetomium fimeti]|uniref:Uncharacterized protein n=1 Tax=Chaetomium fimeti TaxID=1854472 RepID=A0AAE0HLM4_9PEZI|nr:hypothetical protein B0H64DRAFT_83474 [Chaetomium fimeti]